MSEKTNDEGKRNWWASPWALIGLLVAALLLFGSWAGFLVLGPRALEFGSNEFGDAFGPVTGFATALALVFALWSVQMQQQELRESRKELEKQSGALKDQVKQLTDQNKLQAVHNKLLEESAARENAAEAARQKRHVEDAERAQLVEQAMSTRHAEAQKMAEAHTLQLERQNALQRRTNVIIGRQADLAATQITADVISAKASLQALAPDPTRGHAHKSVDMRRISLFREPALQALSKLEDLIQSDVSRLADGADGVNEPPTQP